MSGKTPADKVIAAKLTFATLGLLFSMLQVFLAVLLALIGVTIDYDVAAAVGPAKLKLVSASPGVLLFLVGNALFGFSLMRQFDVTETSQKQGLGSTSPVGGEPLHGVNSPPMQVPPIDSAKGPE